MYMYALTNSSSKCISRWKTDGFAWLYVCVSLNLVVCVFYLIVLMSWFSCLGGYNCPR